MQTQNSTSDYTLAPSQVTLSLAHGKALGRRPLSPWPERILQFGEGNFLRGFVDWMVEVLNRETDFRGGIVAIKPTRSSHTENLEQLRRQDHLYTVVLRGLRQGQVYEESRLITSIVSSLHIEKDWEALLQVVAVARLDKQAHQN
jgi:tagaturonate reductase